MVSLKYIKQKVEAHAPAVLEVGDNKRAAVAMVLREHEDDCQVLFIERASHRHDPWSGQMAFPGGRVDAEDPSPRHAAERETLEEVGIDLSCAEYLGRLDDQQGRHRGHPAGIVVQGFVYLVDGDVQVERNYEVADALWVPLGRFLDPRFYTQVEHPVDPGERFPGVMISDKNHQVVWGLTRRFVVSFFGIIEVEFSG